MNLRRRLVYGFIVAVLLHVVFLGMIPRPVVREHKTVEAPRMRIIVLRKPRPPHRKRKPKPVAIPKITRSKIVAQRVAGATTRGAVQPRKIVRLAAAPPKAVRRHELIKATPLPLPVASMIPLDPPQQSARGIDGSAADGPAMTGSGAAGSGDEGTGNAAAGNGNGDAIIPCGEVNFTKIGKDQIQNGMIAHEMQVRIHTASGDSLTEHIPYRFVFASHEVDPYWDKNHGNSTILSLVQFPPAGFDRSTLGPVMQTVLKHSSVEGITLFPECEGDAKR